MTEEQIKQYGDMIRRLGFPPFDPPLNNSRFYRPDPFETAARVVEAILREQQTKHQEKLEAIRGQLAWVGYSLGAAQSRHAELEKLLAAE